MSAAGRAESIAGLQQWLNQHHLSGWSLALFDDAGQFLPFSNNVEAIRSRIDNLERHVSPPQLVGGPWMSLASRAIAEIGSRPGRRAIIFASDLASDSSLHDARRLRVLPSELVDAAVRAQTPMYAVQASGPGTVIPFGSSQATVGWKTQRWTSLEGQEVVDRTNSQSVALGEVFSDFVWSAYQTGGRPARTVRDAFEKIAEDAEGFYQITFRPNPREADGGWHLVSTEVRSPRLHGKYASYYAAPLTENRQKIPDAILAALDAHAHTPGLDAAAHVWIFPDKDGLSTGVMAADFAWPSVDESVVPQSKVQIFAQIFDETGDRAVGSWLTERDWNTSDDGAPSIHWQREAPLYPGTYSLRVFALDPASKRVVTRTFPFTVDPPDGTGIIRFSHPIVADRCLADDEREGRVNLLDPLTLDGCLLAPSASGSFSRDDQLKVLVRFYPREKTVTSTILTSWKAYVSVGNGPPFPLTITEDNVRGFIASGLLDLEKLNLRPGKYKLSAGFDIGAKDPVFVRPGELTIVP